MPDCLTTCYFYCFVLVICGHICFIQSGTFSTNPLVFYKLPSHASQSNRKAPNRQIQIVCDLQTTANTRLFLPQDNGTRGQGGDRRADQAAVPGRPSPLLHLLARPARALHQAPPKRGRPPQQPEERRHHQKRPGDGGAAQQNHEQQARPPGASQPVHLAEKRKVRTPHARRSPPKSCFSARICRLGSSWGTETSGSCADSCAPAPAASS
jgi:hypothetical protein